MKTVYYYGLKHYEALLVSVLFFGEKVKLVEDFKKALAEEYSILSCVLNGVRVVVVRSRGEYRVLKWSDVLEALSGTSYQKLSPRNQF